jgi:hypothetical protein
MNLVDFREATTLRRCVVVASDQRYVRTQFARRDQSSGFANLLAISDLDNKRIRICARPQMVPRRVISARCEKKTANVRCVRAQIRPDFPLLSLWPTGFG